MRLTSWSILGMALGLVGLVFPYAMAAEQASRPLPSAQLVAVEGASSTYHLIDYDGRVVTAVVPSQSTTDIQHSSDNTVHATLASVDSATNRVSNSALKGEACRWHSASQPPKRLAERTRNHRRTDTRP